MAGKVFVVVCSRLLVHTFHAMFIILILKQCHSEENVERDAVQKALMSLLRQDVKGLLLLLFDSVCGLLSSGIVCLFFLLIYPHLCLIWLVATNLGVGLLILVFFSSCSLTHLK